METQDKKFIRMTTEPVEKLICSLAVPTIVSMLVTALYNIVDTFFVGRIGTEATAGVGLALPLMAVIQAFGFFFGQGSGNYISRTLGAKDRERASVMASTGFFSALLFGLLIALCGLLGLDGLLRLLGAREGLVTALTVANARAYLRPILCAAPFTCVSFVLNNQLRHQGNAMFAMVGIVSGAVLNVALDPLLIFGANLGVFGAALATAVSQAFGCTLLYIGTLRSDSLKIRPANFRPNLFYLKNMAVGGVPSLFRQGLNSVAVLCLNAAAAAAADPGLGDAAIAAFSVVSRIVMFIFSIVLGFGQAFQPVCGFNYGAKRYDRLRRAYVFVLRVSVLFLLTAAVLLFSFAPRLIGLFRDDPAVISIGRSALRAQCCTLALMGAVVMTNMLYQNIGRVVGATLLAVARQGLLFIPIVLTLPHLVRPPIWGVILTQPLADVFTFLIAVFLAVRMYRELSRPPASPPDEAPDIKTVI